MKEKEIKEAIRFIEMASQQLGLDVKKYQKLLESGVEVIQDKQGNVVEVLFRGEKLGN